MFQRRSQPQTLFGTALRMAELIFHDSVRNIRKGHRHALIGLLMNMLQTLLFVGIFYVMFTVLGMRTLAVRGDFLLYLLSGIFLFMTHNKTLKAVMGAGSAPCIHRFCRWRFCCWCTTRSTDPSTFINPAVRWRCCCWRGSRALRLVSCFWR